MTFIDLFAGVGGFRRGMELAGHKCVGFCEWDKFATASYTSMHLITEEQRKHLETMDIKKRQKEILKEEYRNGEWYSADVRLLTASNVPKCDCWCFGAPCQDFSVAGKRAGLDGDRSSLVREVFRVIGEISEEDRPEWLIYENVKGMLSSNRGFDFAAIILEMEQLGYDIEWQLFNTKNFGVPQNRERVYTVGHLRARGRKQIFPLKGTDGENSFCNINPTVIGGYGNINFGKQWRQGNRVYDGNKVDTALQAEPVGNLAGNTCLYSAPVMFGIDKNVLGQETECANALTAREDRGVSNFKQTGTAIAIPITDIETKHGYNKKGVVHTSYGVCRCMTGQGHTGNEPKVAIPVLTPDRPEKRQNGRRFKDNGEPSFTLTSQDRHGVAISISGYEVTGTTDVCHCLNANDQRKVFGAKQERTLAAVGFLRGVRSEYGKEIRKAYEKGELQISRHEFREYDIREDGVSNTIDSVQKDNLLAVEVKEAISADCAYNQGIIVKLNENTTVYAVWYEKYQCYIAIRKLTPKECFRLQGWTDDYFEKAKFVNSDSQLYKQAGNGVTVDVVAEIGKALT